MLGGNFIHVANEPRPRAGGTTLFFNNLGRGKLCQFPCISRVSEEDAESAFQGADFSTLKLSNRHKKCYPSTINGSSRALSINRNLNLLYACRQVYNEARGITYSANTFSFNTSESLQDFSKIHWRCLAIRSVRIQLFSYDNEKWEVLATQLLNNMKFLQQLYIDILLPSPRELFPREKKRLERHLGRLSNLPVRKVVIIVGNWGFAPSANTQRFFVFQERVWADWLKKKLLRKPKEYVWLDLLESGRVEGRYRVSGQSIV